MPKVITIGETMAAMAPDVHSRRGKLQRKADLDFRKDNIASLKEIFMN